MDCKICHSQTREAFKHLVLNKHVVKYMHCPQCGFLNTEEPYWLEEAYAEPINLSDTGYVSRNIYLARRTLTIFSLLFGKKNIFLDYAGGYGLLTRLMRDYGLNFLWSDLYTANLFARGFEYKDECIRALTCFECFEHFSDPATELEKILAITKNIFFSTRLLPKEIPDPEQWDYYGFDHGQHVSFYSDCTLKFLAQKYKLNYYSDGKNLHLFTVRKYPYWLLRLVLSVSRLPIEFILKRCYGSLTTIDQKNFTNS